MKPGEVYEFGPWGEYLFRYSPPHDPSIEGKAIHLTPFERALLEIFLEEPDQELRRSQLEERLWPDGGNRGTNALNAHASNLRRKLGYEGRLFQRTNTGYRWVGSVRRVTPSNEPAAINTALIAVPKPRATTLRPGLFVAVAAGTSAVHQLLAELAEVAFISGRIAPFTPIAAVNSAVMLAGGVVGLWSDWVLTRRQRTNGVAVSLGAVAASLGAIAVIAWSFLPTQLEVTIAPFGMAPHVGFLKSAIVYQALLSALFLHLPFHFAAVLNSEILAGRADNVSALIGGRADAVVPDQGIFIRPAKLWVIFAICAAFGIPMTLHLLSAVTQGAEGRLFSLLAMARFLAWWGGATFGACWYTAQINRLKRLALT
jgi:DNA-binding winged helix-turn-helix (wHTH) protein